MEQATGGQAGCAERHDGEHGHLHILETCGHEERHHGDHLDFEHDGHWHAKHGDHWDDHE